MKSCRIEGRRGFLMAREEGETGVGGARGMKKEGRDATDD